MDNLPTNTDMTAPAFEKLPNFLSQNIRLLRRRMGLSQQDLAEKVGLNRGNIASYETGTAEPKICKLLRISKLLGVTTHDLTRFDLAETGRMEQALQSFSEEESADRQKTESMLRRVDEIELVMSSVKHLYNFRAAELDLAHPDVKAMSHYYDQMQNVAEILLKDHRNLLNELRCSCK
jgi:transcriptional regulator with XRE-family HTH domain